MTHDPRPSADLPESTDRPDRVDAAVQAPERLAEVARLGLDVSDGDATIDAALETAARTLGLPVALATVVLDDAQHFVAARGLSGWLADAGGTPIEWSFCRHAVADRAPFVVEDATRHPALASNPLVTEDGIRCYAGAPLVTSAGQAVGALCVIGHAPRTFSAEEIAQLEALAAGVVAHLERRAG